MSKEPEIENIQDLYWWQQKRLTHLELGEFLHSLVSLPLQLLPLLEERERQSTFQKRR